MLYNISVQTIYTYLPQRKTCKLLQLQIYNFSFRERFFLMIRVGLYTFYRYSKLKTFLPLNFKKARINDELIITKWYISSTTLFHRSTLVNHRWNNIIAQTIPTLSWWSFGLIDALPTKVKMAIFSLASVIQFGSAECWLQNWLNLKKLIMDRMDNLRS